MKIMIAGPWRWPQYEDAFARGLRDNGADVCAFKMSRFFDGILGKQQSALPVPGPALWRLNRGLIRDAKRHQPDWILFWRPTHILPGTLKRLSALGIQLASYNNDDPFGPRAHGNVPWHHYALWFWYLRCLPWFNRNFFYRRINCEEAVALGARHAAVLMPYFLPWQDRPVELVSEERARFSTDVVFVGHYEPDGREQALRALAGSGLGIKLWGGSYWTQAVLGCLYEQLQPIEEVIGDEYTKALCGAKVCLAFLSKLNRDTYTRRCFEIPACGCVMLAERTADLQRLFREDREACFFSSVDELVVKARWLLENPEAAKSIAAAGLSRVWKDGHSVDQRAKQFLVELKGLT